MDYTGYAVELYFDAALTAKIRTLWDTVYARCGGVAVGGQPHISLAAVDTTEPEPLFTVARTFAQQTARLPVQLSAVGTFPGAENVVYLAPVVTQALLEVHMAFHQRLTAQGLTSFPYYRPGQWIPHCTVGIRLPPEKIGYAVELCRTSEIFGSGVLCELSLIALPAIQEKERFPLMAV